MRYNKGERYWVRGKLCMYWGIIRDENSEHNDEARFILFHDNGWPAEYRYLNRKQRRYYRVADHKPKEVENHGPLHKIVV